MHVSDEGLYALLDGELSPHATAEIRAHLNRCPTCGHRWEELERQRREVAQLLGSLDCAPPQISPDALLARARTRPKRGRGLLAAGLATLLIGAVAVAFAGSLPRQWLARLLPNLGSPRVRQPSQLRSSRRSGIALVPGQALEVAFREAQAVGSISITLVADSQVTVRALGDTVGYSVGTDAVVIANAGRTTASYEIVLPRSLPRVSVRVGRRVVFSKNDSEIVAPVSPDSASEYVIPFTALPGKNQPGP